jgi:NAD-dependent dihydropyrimidine dehydrogenase PreA subunit
MLEKTLKPKVVLKFITLIIVVVLLSLLMTSLWQGKPEPKKDNSPLVFRDGMTIAEFGNENKLPGDLLKKTFHLQSKEDQQKSLDSLNIPHNEITERLNKELTLVTEYESRNWVKIPLKFFLWILFLSIVFYLMRRKKITANLRKIFYLTAIVVFGIILGSDPGPMGTIKDAIVLYGTKGLIFPPRMIALTAFLLLVFLANKFICSWGCQAGTLQDIIFRLNRNHRDTAGIMRQYRPPFLWTNTIRVAFFLIFTSVAFAWGNDLIDPIDPFKIYKPTAIGIGGAIFLGLIGVASLFVYRPWCQFVCPFGLIGWSVEKVSLFKIIVNHETCIGCRSCEKACPSTVMGAILKQDRMIPDCFACGSCIEVCPTGSIQLATGKRGRPPEGKFDQNPIRIEDVRTSP